MLYDRELCFNLCFKYGRCKYSEAVNCQKLHVIALPGLVLFSPGDITFLRALSQLNFYEVGTLSTK